MQNDPMTVDFSSKFKVFFKILVIITLMAFMGVPSCKRTPEGGQSSLNENISPETLKTGLPILVDLGATKCIPCKMMAPVLEELKKEYAGSLEVVFIDVWENNQAAKNFGIQLIPTQIFYDAKGRELFRHEGFFAKEDILQKWKEFGVNL
jgi:thioredoxin 1